MGRKRKVPIPNEEKGNEENQQLKTLDNGPIRGIMAKIQLNETCHNKYIKELSHVYTMMDHDGFIYTFIKMIKTAMAADESNEYANMTLMFCAKFITSFQSEETHPIMIDVLRWLLTTISYNPNIRFRLCQFVNLILNALGQEATLDDPICDNIMEYMIGRCVDVSPNVRVQAILAMQRLQVPDNPDDAVLRIYQYHLCSDPSPRVRQTVITCMGRNYHTIPYILDRLSDIDEKVRRHTYLHMSSYPVRSYKVSQRLTLLEQGLNDRSDCVRKVVTNIMLQQWIESYQKNVVALIEALKLDSSPAEIERFRKISRQALRDIFKRQEHTDLVSCLVLETDGDFYRCVPHEKLTVEMGLYWQCLTEYFQTDMTLELDFILPELSTFCAYVETYCQMQKEEMDKFELMEFQYTLLSLVEILYSFDMGDEVGRGNLQKLLAKLLTDFSLNEKVIEVIVRCAENLLTDQNARHQFFLDIIHDICGLNGKQQDLVHDRHLISELLANSTDAQLNLKLSSLKVKILDLEEQEMNYAQQKDSVRVQQIVEEKNMATEEFTILLHPLLQRHNGALSAAAQPQFSKVVKNECVLRGLQIAFHMVVSKKVTSLGHAACRLYHDFIFRHIASNQISIRDWALKCAAAFSMHYEPLAKDVFSELYSQFFRNHNIRIWETAITCIFELLDRYGVENFVVHDEQNKSKRAGRQLYTTLEFVDGSEDEQLSTTLGQGVGVIYMMSHFLDTCEDTCIAGAIVNGFCRLILHGHIDNRDIMEKLLSRYFNPSAEPEINQTLGIFLENLIQNRKQALLQVCIMATINSILSAPYDSPLHDIRPDTITRFIIDATRPDSNANKNEENIHNQLALSFLNEMVSNANNKELCKLLAKELLTLEVNVQNQELKNKMKELADKLIQSKFEPHTTKKIIDFKDMLDGIFNPPPKRPTDSLDTDDDEEEETEGSTYRKEQSKEQEQNALHSDANNPATSEVVSNQETVEHIEAEKPTDEDSSLQMASTGPSTCTETPTRFGSDNNTTHRSLRKSLNASRNNSIESTESIQDVQRQSKIRIEARIDSDKKTNKAAGDVAQTKARTTRSLRLAQRAQKIEAQNSKQAHDKKDSKKTQEPKIIEKIINPKKLNSVAEKKNQKSSALGEVRNSLNDKAQKGDEKKDNASQKEDLGAKEKTGNKISHSSQEVDYSLQCKPAKKNQKASAPQEGSRSVSAKTLNTDGEKGNAREKENATEVEKTNKILTGENVRLTRSRSRGRTIAKENNVEKNARASSTKNTQNLEATTDGRADKEVQQIFQNESEHSRRVTNGINRDENDTIVISSDEELNTSDVIPPSPEVISNTTMLRARTRNPRVNHGQSKGNTTDLSTARSNPLTPLRGGRKRILRTSPRLLVATSSIIITSPPRKQQRTEIALKRSMPTRAQAKKSIKKVSSLPLSLKRIESGKEICSEPTTTTTSHEKQKDDDIESSPKKKPAMVTRSASKKVITTKWRLPLRRVSSRTSRQSLIKRSNIPVRIQFAAKRTKAVKTGPEKLNNSKNVRAAESKIPVASSFLKNCFKYILKSLHAYKMNISYFLDQVVDEIRNAKKDGTNTFANKSDFLHLTRKVKKNTKKKTKIRILPTAIASNSNLVLRVLGLWGRNEQRKIETHVIQFNSLMYIHLFMHEDLERFICLKSMARQMNLCLLQMYKSPI
uniref:Nuclear condensin complex subunit 3 C-terminal domain-containing protein n=1 Tax=Glossina brevipalpis TaxID=37001 RepID=A0A1A9WQH7_9MUSC